MNATFNAMMAAMGWRFVGKQSDGVIYPVEFQCEICGDWHESDNVPRMCETGDGE